MIEMNCKMKKQVPIFFMIALFLLNIGIGANASAQTNLPGRLVSTVTTSKGTTIYLSENLSYGIYSIAAFVKQGGKYVPENVFRVRKHYQSVINSVKYESWFSSCPDGGFFHFNMVDNTLYIPLIDEYMSGADRYIVYRFNGEYFVYKGKYAGYWLHSSLHNYDNLFALGRTKDFIVRIDVIDDGSYRYAAWSSNKTMKDKPSIILYGDTSYDDGCLNFYNGDFMYTFDSEKKELRVYEGAKLIKRQKMEILYW